jgi:beta-phosphoglucomutase-like phosphatase (HAD superfamily)
VFAGTIPFGNFRGILHLLHSTVCAEDTQRGKPAPDPFLEASRRLGVPEECPVFENSPAGSLSAGAAIIPLWIPKLHKHREFKSDKLPGRAEKACKK